MVKAQSTLTCKKSTIETLKQRLKSAQLNKNNHSGIFIPNFEEISYIYKKQNRKLKHCRYIGKKYL